MYEYQEKFIKFALEHGALKFGNYTLKSGRISPYFFNTGAFNSGSSMWELAKAYADTIVTNKIDFDMLFGPAYKGIPLGTAIAVALHVNHNIDVPVSFNRKEEKDHGEGGSTLGAKLEGNILVVDDVISAGTSIDESHSLIQTHKANLSSVVIALNRQERGHGKLSAIQEVEARHNVQVLSIINLDNIVEYASKIGSFSEQIGAINEYSAEYGTISLG
jgi:orotate phosphoribosyltransferase